MPWKARDTYWGRVTDLASRRHGARSRRGGSVEHHPLSNQGHLTVVS